MNLGGRKLSIWMLAAVLAVSGTVLVAKDKKKKDKDASAQMDPHQRAIHALNRLTFGPRPGDVDRVMSIGVDKWIDEQLNPGKVSWPTCCASSHNRSPHSGPTLARSGKTPWW